MSPPEVSIVVPLHEGAGTVPETLDAIAAQTFGAWELIVVADASTHGGPALVRAWAAGFDQPVRVLDTRASTAVGPSATRNRGLEQADGDVVAFLDSDDLWDATFLARRMAASARIPRSPSCGARCGTGTPTHPSWTSIRPPASNRAASRSRRPHRSPPGSSTCGRPPARPPASSGVGHSWWYAYTQNA